MNIREAIKSRKLVADGALGTYYNTKYDIKDSETEEFIDDNLSKDSASIKMSESANISHSDRIKEIHLEYIEAGADIITTNTFALFDKGLDYDMETIRKSAREAVAIAKSAANESSKTDVYVAGDIGPVGNVFDEGSSLDAYKLLIDIYTEEKLPVIIFETFSSISDIGEAVSYAREKDKDVFIMVSISINKNGYTSLGLSGKRLISELCDMEEIDCVGLNCSIGSAHMAAMLDDYLRFFHGKYISIMPNAGYPEQFKSRMVFKNNADYYAGNMAKIADKNVAILGGCCGTRPDYIRAICEKVDLASPAVVEENKSDFSTVEEKATAVDNLILDKLNRGEKVYAVEIDPPFNANYYKQVESMKTLKDLGVDIVTIADSPMGRSRVDSVLMSVKLKHDTGVNVMPHMCCRDKNMIAMRSSLLGAYINGIRNFLFVTGDPVPAVSRNMTTGVFDTQSIKLMEYVNEMNKDVFADDPVVYGGALNYGTGLLENIAKRMKLKMNNGCAYFLTQPIYSDEDVLKIRSLKEMTGAKILCGIMPLISYKNACFIKNEMTGINVPDEIIARYDEKMSREEAEQVGADVAMEIMDKLMPFADGFYFMVPFNRVSVLDKMHKKFPNKL